MTLDEWRAVIEYWLSGGRDIKYLYIPQDVADALGIELPPQETDSMTDTQQTETQTVIPGTAPEAAAAATEAATSTATEVPNNSFFEFKKKRHFDGTVCGLKGCSRKLPVAGSYVLGNKPTKNSDEGRIWFGPACEPCVTKAHDGMKPTTLAELAHQRQGASDLALVLDTEVGDIHKRLAAAGIDENGQAATQAEGTALAAPQGASLTLEPLPAAVIPTGLIETEGVAINNTLLFLGTFHIQTQQDMDSAGVWLQTVKSKWKDLDETRLSLSKPHRDMAAHIKAQFDPTLTALATAEGILKQKMAEGNTRAQQAQQAALQQAQQAHAAGDMQQAGAAAQAAAASDVAMPPSVIQYQPVVKFEVAAPEQLPTEFWSPDMAKIQAAINAGYRQIPGVRIWEEPAPIGSRAS